MNRCPPEVFYAMAFTVTIYVWIRHVLLPVSTSTSIPGSCLKLALIDEGLVTESATGGTPWMSF